MSLYRAQKLIRVHYCRRISGFYPCPIIATYEQVVDVIVFREASLNDAALLQKMGVLSTKALGCCKLTIHAIEELFMSLEPFSICDRLSIPLHLRDEQCRRGLILDD